MTRVGKDCVGATNTIEENNCQTAALATTQHNLAGFLSALEGIVGPQAIEASQRAWLSYRATQCDATFDFYSKGTIAPSARARCVIAITRSRMRDLDELFEGPLHN